MQNFGAIFDPYHGSAVIQMSDGKKALESARLLEQNYSKLESNQDQRQTKK